MKIENYSFGNITIDGKEYTSDLIIFPDKVQGDWWRAEGHDLSMSDLDTIIEYQPDTLIIGNGASGVMKVRDEVIQEIKNKGILEVIVENSDKACELFNELISQEKKVILGIHLTC